MKYRFVAAFKSRSSDAEYDVKEDERGDLSCPCRGWIYKRKGKPRTCVHVEAVALQRMKAEPSYPWWDESDPVIVKPKPKRGVPKTMEPALPTFTLPRPVGARLIEFAD